MNCVRYRDCTHSAKRRHTRIVLPVPLLWTFHSKGWELREINEPGDAGTVDASEGLGERGCCVRSYWRFVGEA